MKFEHNDHPLQNCARAYLERGINGIRQRNYRHAERMLRGALCCHPTFLGYRSLGTLMLASGRVIEARQNFEKALMIQPNKELTAMLSKLPSSFVAYYDNCFYDLLDIRRDTFRQIFKLLESRRKSDYTIVETGTVRRRNDWKHAGQSTILFDLFVNFHGGRVFSVDIDPEICEKARRLVSPRTEIVCADSVSFLGNLDIGSEIDLLYLDSLDADWDDTHSSALHHLKELCAVQDKLGHCILAVDDNMPESLASAEAIRPLLYQKEKGNWFFETSERLRGKGEYIDDFMRTLGNQRVVSGYQAAWAKNPERIVVSMTTLPGRIEHIGPALESIKDQTILPNAIYLNLPAYSHREQREYRIPGFLRDDPWVTVLNSRRDWGPATKLLPVLEKEQAGSTILITVDDDKIYHPTLVEDLIQNCRRHPGCALGFCGYNLKSPPLRHPNFDFFRSSAVRDDTPVDALGGVDGILYRRSFFDDRIFHYDGYPASAFYVDDDWIAGHLERRGVQRIVLSATNTVSSNDSPGSLNLSNGLNDRCHASSNIAHQETLLTCFKKEGLFRSRAT